MTRSRAIYLTIILALAGGGAVQAFGLALSFFAGSLPASESLRPFFLFVWLPLSVLAAWSGLIGGFLGVRDGDLRSRYLTVFVLLFSLVFVAHGTELGWSAVRLALNIGSQDFRIGLNFLGIPLMIALLTLRDSDIPAQGSARAEVPAKAGQEHTA